MLSLHLAISSPNARQKLLAVFKAAGLPLGEAHGAGAPIIRAVRKRGGGLVLCDEWLPDMNARHLQDALGDEARVILLRQGGVMPSPPGEGFPELILPLSARELAEQVRVLLHAEDERQHLRHQYRTDAENGLITEAKSLMMSRYRIDEQEAHRLLQRASMQKGTRMTMVAQEFLQAERSRS